MAFTYTTLSDAIQDYLVSHEAVLITNMPVIVQQAEDRILNNAQLPDFRKNVIGSTTISDQYLSTPTDFLAPYSLAVDNSGYETLIIKDVNFIREAYPSSGAEGVPKYYGIFEDNNFILGPTPDAAYTAELHYFYRPESIVTATTSWLGTNAESCLLYGCLVEAYTFQKGDADMLAVCEKRYTDALEALKILAEGRNRSDAYRSG
jgi:hypothetical protein